MNIFILDANKTECVKAYVDKHVTKMPVEHTQMLANAYSVEELSNAPRTQKGNIRKHSYLKHPCSKWVLYSLDNWNYLLELTLELFKEYTYRYERTHFCEEFVQWAKLNPPKLVSRGFTRPSLAMPEEYKTENPIKAYRNYYRGDKTHLFSWKKRKKPFWLN